MPNTTIPCPYVIVADSGVHEAQRFGDGPSAEVKFKVAWGDRYTFINGAGATVKGSSKSSLARTVPLQYPPSPNLFAMDAEIEPFPKDRISTDGLWVSYPSAIITITFRVYPWAFDSVGSDASIDPSGQPWTTTTLDFSADFVTTPDSYFAFGTPGTVGTADSLANPTPTQASIGVVVQQCAITLKRHWVPFMPVNAILSLLATPLNNAAIRPRRFRVSGGDPDVPGFPHDARSRHAGQRRPDVRIQIRVSAD